MGMDSVLVQQVLCNPLAVWEVQSNQFNPMHQVALNAERFHPVFESQPGRIALDLSRTNFYKPTSSVGLRPSF